MMFFHLLRNVGDMNDLSIHNLHIIKNMLLFQRNNYLIRSQIYACHDWWWAVATRAKLWPDCVISIELERIKFDEDLNFESMNREWNGSIGLNTLRPRQNGRRFPDDILKWIFFNENVLISIEISLKFVPKGQINNIPALVQIMAWRRSGDKPLSEPMMVSLLTHICVTRAQWVKHCTSPSIWQQTTYRPPSCTLSELSHHQCKVEIFLITVKLLI